MKVFVAFLLFLAGLPGLAASSISVQQITDLIVFSEAHGQSDKDVARKIANMQLTERMSNGTLAALMSRAPGALTKEALQTLGDQSSFLDPPASEFLDVPVPPLEEQKASLEKARSYANSYIRKLPNFFCTLVMRRLDDGNGTQHLRLNDVVTGDLTFNGGKQLTAVRSVNGIRSTDKLPTHGLTTHDEVGGLLASIFAEGGGLKAVWSHWENVEGTRVAVFRYALDKAHSHFTVSYCCSPGVVTAPVTIITAATGELSIDPATGAVLRVTEQAVDIPKGFAVQKAAVMVEYAAVQIGSASFICPIRSISISDMGLHESAALDSFSLSATRHSLNEMLLTNYHEFGAASRIVAGGAAQAVENPAASKVAAPVPAPDESGTARETLPPSGLADLSELQDASPLEQASAPIPPPQLPAAPAAVFSAETTERAQSLADNSFKVRVNVVTVRTVVRDKQGNYVGDLQKNEFDLLDNSKHQLISGFSVEHSKNDQKLKEQLLPPATTAPTSPPAQLSKATSATGTATQTPDRYVVYLFDDLHLSIPDLSLVRKAAHRALADPEEPDTRIAVATSSGRTMLDFTNDRTKISQTLARIRPTGPSPNAQPTCPPRMSYYLADQILNKVDRDALRLAVMEQEDCASKNPDVDANITARVALEEHEGEVRAAVSMLKVIVRRLAIMPGQRSIVLISPGFIETSFFSEITDLIESASRNGVMINTIDARGLYVPWLAEAIEDPNRAVANNPEALTLLEKYNRQEQETRSDPLGELANGTGGTFFQNSNDLYAGFKEFTAAPDVFYLLGFKPQGLKADGAYHRLNVKITDRKGMEVHARQGYYAPKVISDPAAQAKEEIQNAVFSRDEIQDIPTVLTIQPPTGITPARLTVIAHVDLRSIAFTERDGQGHNSIVATFSLFDGDGNYIHGQQNKIELNYPKEQLAAKVSAGLNLKSEFEVKPGQYLVRLVLRDEAGNMSASSKTVDIPATTNTALRIDPIFPLH